MRGQGLHDLAVRDLADEILQGLLIGPNRECPELASEGTRLQRVADDAGRGLELALGLRRVAEEFRDGTEMA